MARSFSVANIRSRRIRRTVLILVAPFVIAAGLVLGALMAAVEMLEDAIYVWKMR